MYSSGAYSLIKVFDRLASSRNIGYIVRVKSKKPEIFLERKFEAQLKDWKANPDRLPLIVKGARQVGKTECIRHFAEGRYVSFVEINFALQPEFKAITRDGYTAKNVKIGRASCRERV